MVHTHTHTHTHTTAMGGRNQSQTHDKSVGMRWTSDGVHPNDEGYKVLALEVYHTLMKTKVFQNRLAISQDPLGIRPPE